MYYQDNFSTSFYQEKAFMGFLDEIEERADWKVCPTDTLHVSSAEECADTARMMLPAELKENILQDTNRHTGLFLEADGICYPLGSTAIRTLENRARISGNALQDLERDTLAEVLNHCLRVTRGNALLRIHEGKVRAVHGGDASDYAILPMTEIFETASMYLKENFNHVRFESSSFSHSLVTVSWEVRDDSLLDTYRDLLLQYGYAAGSEISAYIRVHSSDVAASGANIFCTIREGTRELVLGSALKLEHTNGAVIEDFARNMAQIFSRYQENVAGLEKLFQISVEHPANAMAGLMKKAGIGKTLISQTVEQFKVSHGGERCNGYELYCGICEVIFLAQCKGVSAKLLIDLEEMVSRCLTYRFQDFDVTSQINL